jgi:hypothetical protein
MRWIEHAARMGQWRDACSIFVGRPEGKGPPGRSRRKWRDNWTLEKVDGVLWSGFIWLRIRTCDGLL